MMKRQRGDTRDVRYLDGEQFDSGVGQERWKQLAEWLREGQLTEARLDSHLPRTGYAQGAYSPAASIPSRARLLMRSLPSMNHRKA